MHKKTRNIPTYITAPIINGKRHGYGEIHYGGKYSHIVFSTLWIKDIPTYAGFWYDLSTMKVLAIQVNESHIDIFDNKTCHQPDYRILDKENGERWEGLAYNNKPCGLGTYYDEDNNRIYEGLCVNWLWEGFGTVYYPFKDVYSICSENSDNSNHNSNHNNNHNHNYNYNYNHNHNHNHNHNLAIETQGWWCHGTIVTSTKRYTRIHTELYTGTCQNGRFVTPQLCLRGDYSFFLVHCFLQELTIDDNSLNTITQLNLNVFCYLRHFRVGNNACQHCCLLQICHLPDLMSISIGKNAFTMYNNFIELLISDEKAILKKKRRLVIHDCPQIQSIFIHEGSFSDYTQLSIRETPKLETIQLGLALNDNKPILSSCCFFYVSTLQLSRLN